MGSPTCYRTIDLRPSSFTKKLFWNSGIELKTSGRGQSLLDSLDLVLLCCSGLRILVNRDGKNSLANDSTDSAYLKSTVLLTQLILLL